MNFCEKKKNAVFFRSFKNVQICLSLFGPPFAPVFPWFGMSCCEHVTSGLTHFVNTKRWKGAFCVVYEAKFIEVKQAR